MNYRLFLLNFFVLLGHIHVQSQPNFVVIISDDMGWTGSSVQMDTNIPGSQSDFYVTPELEKLAAAGMTFSQAYAPSPKCSPSRCSILTGRTTARNQFTNTSSQVDTGQMLIEASSNTSINPSDTTLAEWLKSTGLNYRTAHYGKWHLGSGTAFSPENNGFDLSDGNTNNGDGNQGATVQNDPKKIFSLTDRAISFLQDAVRDDVPFYLQLSHYAVHSSIEARQATIDLYNDPNQRPKGSRHDNVAYAAMTEDTDSGIGILLDSITSLGLDDNTYVIFMSDNGGQMNFTDNGPLFRGKTFIFEGGIRVPFIVKGPNIAPGSYAEEAIVAYDLFPTFAELTGSDQTLPANLDGQSIAPIFSGDPFARSKPLYFHSPHYDNNPQKRPRSALVDGNHKLIVDYESGTFQLFDLGTDIGESTDISSSFPMRTREMCIALRDHLKSVGALMPALDPSHPNFSGSGNDVDDDGLEDAWELRELLTYTYGPLDDPDGDGKNNLMEFNEGTDPYQDEVVSSLNLRGDQHIQVALFPNPTEDALHIAIETVQPIEKIWVEVFDVIGRRVTHVSNTNDFDMLLNTSSWLPGMYLVKLSFGGSSTKGVVRRFLKN